MPRCSMIYILLIFLTLVFCPAGVFAEPLPAETTGQTQQETALQDHQLPPLKRLTEMVRADQSKAPALLHEAITVHSLKLQPALEAVLLGMKNPQRRDFEALIDQALELGITLDSAQEIAGKLKNSGEICK